MTRIGINNRLIGINNNKVINNNNKIGIKATCGAIAIEK